MAKTTKSPPSNDKTFYLSGTIRAADGKTPLPQMRVLAFDCDLRAEQPLHDQAVLTDREGKYAVSYTAVRFIRAEKGSADLRIKVFSPDDDALKTPVFASEIRFNAPERTEIDLNIPAEAYTLPTEWDGLVKEAAVLGRRSGLAIQEWEENAQHHDLIFIAGETGREMKVVRAFALAHRLAKQTKLPGEAWFALLRYEAVGMDAGMAPDGLAGQAAKTINALARMESDVARSALQRAIQHRSIPEIPEETQETWISGWQALAAEQMDGETERALQIAELAGLPAKKRKPFLEFFRENRRRFDDRLSGALRDSKEFSDKEIEALDTAAKAAELTGDQFDLLQKLQSAAGKKPLDLARLAQQGPEVWDEMLNGLAPHASTRKAATPGADTAPSVSGESLTARFKNAFPTQAFAGALARTQERRERDVATPEQSPLKHADRIRQFLEENPGFDFLDTKTHIETWLNKPRKGERGTAAPGPNTDEGFRDEIKAVQRVFRLNPDFDATTTLLGDGLHSGQQIYLLGEQQFTERYADRPGFTEARARETWRKSAELNHSIVHWLGEMRSAENAGMIKALRTTRAASDGPQSRDAFPTYETLFGPSDICTCEHCRSVYSPAAYLTDAILFLKNRITDGKSAWAVLCERRPDLGFLDFSCDNSNVMLPYIDIVNEILEKEVAGGDEGYRWSSGNEPSEYITTEANGLQKVTYELDIDTRFAIEQEMRITIEPSFSINKVAYSPANLTGESRSWVLRDSKNALLLTFFKSDNVSAGLGIRIETLYQTRGKSEDLIARPQHVLSYPYEDVIGSFSRPDFPPLDLPVEELRLYLNKVGVKRWEMMKALKAAYHQIPCTAEDIACEYFGISSREKTLILQRSDTQAQQTNQWRLSPNDWGNITVRTFLDKSKLDYQQMLALLDLEFINPGGAMFVRYDDNADQSDTQKQFIQNLDATGLDKIYRFLHLWRKTGLKMWELDLLIMHPRFGNGNLGQSDAVGLNAESGFLDKLMSGLELKNLLGIDVEQLICLFGKIPVRSKFTTAGKPRDVSFFDRTFLNPRRFNPVFEGFQRIAEGGQIELPLDTTPVSSALRLKPAELDLLLSALNFNRNTDRLNLEKLSELYAHTTLAKSLRLSIRDWVSLIPLVETADLSDGNDDILQTVPLQIKEVFSQPKKALIWLGQLGQLLQLGFSPEELHFLMVQGPPAAGHPATSEKCQKWMDTIWQQGAPIISRYAPTALPDTPPPVSGNLSIEETAIRERNRREEIIRTTGTLKFMLLAALTDWIGWTEVQANQLTALVEELSAPNVGLAGLTQAKRDALTEGLSPFLPLEYNPQFFQEDLLFNFRTLLSVIQSWKIREEMRPVILKTICQHLPAKDENRAAGLLQQISEPVLLEILRQFGQHSAGYLFLPAATMVFQGLYRMVLVAEKLAVDMKDWGLLLPWFQHREGYFLDPGQTPQWQEANMVLHTDLLLNLSRLCRLQKRWSTKDKSFIGLLDRISEFSREFKRFEDFPEFTAEVTALTGWESAHFDEAKTQLNFFSYFLEPALWEHLDQVFEINKKTNLNYWLLREASALGIEYDVTSRAVTRIAAKYEESQQNDLHRDVQNHLRERKRDALVAYLLSRNSQWKDTNDLYSHFLIDVEMASCQLTSRIVQAHGTVQTFVQRCLLGLEPEVKPQKDAVSWEQWKWMKNYRLWEANRKVFLYPENWLEPELRRDRSPFFKDLENALLQSDLNRDAVENAFLHYVEQLDNVAHLEPMGHWYEEEKDILHVFGRTSGEPHLYYYRQWKENAYWTPWEKVDADIKGDYLIPIVRNGQLYLFWPEFLEEPEMVTTVRVPMQDQLNKSNGNFAVDPPLKKIKIFMASSRIVNGKWSTKNISKIFIELRNLPSNEGTSNLVFTPFFDFIFSSTRKPLSSTSFGFLCLKTKEKYVTSSIIIIEGLFISSGNSHSLEAFDCSFNNSGIETHALLSFKNTIYNNTLYRNMRLYEISNESGAGDSLFIFNNSLYLDSPDQFGIILNQTPGSFSITDSWQPSLFASIQWSANNYYYGMPPIEFSPEVYAVISNGKIDTEAQFKTMYDHFTFTLILFLSNGKNHPFFFSDQKRKYFVMPVFKHGNEQFYYKDYYRYLGEPNESKKISLDEANKNVKYHFHTFYHPLTDFFRQKINSEGLNGLLKRDTQLEKKDFRFSDVYEPALDRTFTFDAPDTYPHLRAYPTEDVDFTPQGAYSSYNWELFFHAPMLIAQRLTKDQRFEEAMQWYHYIFNPLGVENSNENGSTEMPEVPNRYWVTRPFYEQIMMKNSTVGRDEPLSMQTYQGQNIQNWLRQLSYLKSASHDRDILTAQEKAVEIWRKNPFDPHLIARFRTVAYQKGVVMKYLDNLVAWGDQLFRRDTMESVNEATQLYVLAAEILGPRPRKLPQRYEARPLSFNELEPQLDGFSNALVGLENSVPVLPTGNQSAGQQEPPLGSFSMLFFCLPPNDQLLEYWDTVADRLFKIRHCQNIEGVERQLALFAPEVDPRAIIGALAGGGNLDGTTANLQAPLPLYRFQVMLQKANELCNDLKALGGALISALEKKDGEEMAHLRQGQEMAVLEAVKFVKQMQIDEAKENLDGLSRSRLTIQERVTHYQKINKIYPEETLSLSKLLRAQQYQELGQSQQVLAANLAILPDFEIGISGFGGSPTANVKFGSSNFVQAVKASGEGYSFFSSILNNDSIQAAKSGENKRRSEEWTFQETLATKELDQIDRQINAARIRIQIAEKELANHNLQMANASAIDEYMRSKYTNKELYEWMSTQISQVYFQTYQMAYDMSKRAERCLEYELGPKKETAPFIQNVHWDSLKKGLLSAEKLQLDLRKLEQAFMDRNKREFELTKHISLNLLNPFALLQLRENGKCDFAIPEELFDLDFPGHYFRRIKSVSISIPCVAGPYTTINATLRLKRSRIRLTTSISDGYQRKIDEEEDGRFRESFAGIQSIATSSAQNDSGLFELNFRDERYLPFEGTGAISEWTLEMMNEPALRQFDYGTIADVIVHLRYTAQEDGGLKAAATGHLKEITNQLGKVSLERLFSLRHDFPNEWYAWQKQGQDLTVKLEKHHFPYFAQLGDLNIESVKAYPKKDGRIDLSNTVSFDVSGGKTTGWELVPHSVLDNSQDDWFLIVAYRTRGRGEGNNSSSGGTGAGTGTGTNGNEDPVDPSPGAGNFISLRHVVNAGNVPGAAPFVTILDHPQLNGNPAAVLFVSPVWGNASGGVDNPNTFGVRYREDRWVIFNQNIAVPMLMGANFQVLATSPENPHVLVHTATAANSYMSRTYIDHPASNNRPQALLLVTQLYGEYNNHEIAVAYDDSSNRWFIANKTNSAAESYDEVLYGIALYAKFNVLVSDGNNIPGMSAFSHQADSSNIDAAGPWMSFLNNAGINGKPDANLFFIESWLTHLNGQPVSSGGAHNRDVSLLWYDDPTDQYHNKDGYWAIHNSGNRPMVHGRMFNLFVLEEQRGLLPPYNPPANNFDERLSFVAFRHRVGASLNSGANASQLDHPLLNNRPEAMVFANSNYGYRSEGLDNGYLFGVRYNGTRWEITSQWGVNTMNPAHFFNILIAPQDCPNVFTHVATKDSLQINRTFLDHPLVNGKPDVHLMVTPNLTDGQATNHEIGVAYQNERWFIYNNVSTPEEPYEANHGIPEGARFNILVLTGSEHSNIEVFAHQAVTKNIIPSNQHISFISHPKLDHNREAMVFATQAWLPVLGGHYNPSMIALWYDDELDGWRYKEGFWSVYNSVAGVPMPNATVFNIFIVT